MKENKSRLLNMQEAADYLGIGKSTLANWLSKKTQKIVSVKIGSLRKFKVGDLDNFIESCVDTTIDEPLVEGVKECYNERNNLIEKLIEDQGKPIGK